MEIITNDIATFAERVAIAFGLIAMAIEKLIRVLKQKDQQANP